MHVDEDCNMWRILRGLLASITVIAVTVSSAQSLKDSDFQLSVDVELVVLPVSVVDKEGNPFRGLQKEHFAVYEDKVLQDIALFKQEDIPLSVGLVIDASDSMKDKRDRLRAAAMTFIRESNPDDETSIVSFGEDVLLEQEFTRDTRELNRALASMRSSGATALYDAIVQAAQYLEQESVHEKKVLIVVTDGEDNSSKSKLQDALKAVSESKITLYTIGLLTSYSSTYGSYNDSAKGVLKQLAEVSGGASSFPKNINEVEKVCSRIAHDLRNQYTIGYKPSNQEFNGAWRKVQVRVNPPKNTPKLKLRTKQGYYAPTKKRENPKTL